MIVYSDPAGGRLTRKATVFPKGPWGPASHIQRGGIAYDYIVPGDPLTPGWASTPGREADPDRRSGVGAEDHGAADVASRHAADPREARRPAGAEGVEGRAANRVSPRRRSRAPAPARSTCAPTCSRTTSSKARIRGSERPDEWVVLGNHHDAWVFGGVDPSSGTAAMMELDPSRWASSSRRARGRSRTLVFCSWDGEEVTLTGLDRVGRAVRVGAEAESRSPT